MTRRHIQIAALVALGITANRGGTSAALLAPIFASLTPPPGQLAQVEALSPMTFPVDKNMVAQAFQNPANELAALASTSATDPGIRLRAIVALRDFPSPAATSALISTINTNATADRGVALLYVRAAANSLAKVSPADAIGPLAALLRHASRDVRASTATALGKTGNVAAIAPLRQRLNSEPVEQVRLAIEAALHALED